MRLLRWWLWRIFFRHCMACNGIGCDACMGTGLNLQAMVKERE